MTITRSPPSSCCTAPIANRRTVPPTGVVMLASIFIASMVATVWPAWTFWASCTTGVTAPANGAAIWPRVPGSAFSASAWVTSIEVNPAEAEKADPGALGQIAAPFAGAVTPVVQEAQKVQAGQTVATIEAMKMEASITTPVGGTVRRLAIGAVQQLEGGDLVMVIA